MTNLLGRNDDFSSQEFKINPTFHKPQPKLPRRLATQFNADKRSSSLKITKKMKTEIIISQGLDKKDQEEEEDEDEDEEEDEDDEEEVVIKDEQGEIESGQAQKSLTRSNKQAFLHKDSLQETHHVEKSNLRKIIERLSKNAKFSYERPPLRQRKLFTKQQAEEEEKAYRENLHQHIYSKFCFGVMSGLRLFQLVDAILLLDNLDVVRVYAENWKKLEQLSNHISELKIDSNLKYLTESIPPGDIISALFGIGARGKIEKGEIKKEEEEEEEEDQNTTCNVQNIYSRKQLEKCEINDDEEEEEEEDQNKTCNVQNIYSQKQLQKRGIKKEEKEEEDQDRIPLVHHIYSPKQLEQICGKIHYRSLASFKKHQKRPDWIVELNRLQATLSASDQAELSSLMDLGYDPVFYILVIKNKAKTWEEMKHSFVKSSNLRKLYTIMKSYLISLKEKYKLQDK